MTDVNIIYFMFGFLAGAFAGLLVMCMMQISKKSDNEFSAFYKEDNEEDDHEE